MGTAHVTEPDYVPRRRKIFTEPLQTGSVPQINDFYGDIIMAGLTEQERPFMAYAISPTQPDDRRFLSGPRAMPESSATYEIFHEVKDEKGNLVYDYSPDFCFDMRPWFSPSELWHVRIPGFVSVKMTKETRTNRNPETRALYAGDGNGTGPHRYMAEGFGRTIQAANFNMEIENGRMKRIPSNRNHPHIDIILGPEEEAEEARLHVSRNGKEYDGYTILLPGRIRGFGSYRAVNGNLLPYSPDDPTPDRKGYIALPLFTLQLKNGTSDPSTRIADSIFDQIGRRTRSLAIALYSHDGWHFNVINEKAARNAA